jgi:hypothetical protein
VTLLTLLQHPGNGTKLDEIAIFAVPLVVFIVLYIWSRGPNGKGK